MSAGTAAQAVAAFAALRGTHEQPPGSNHVPGITNFLHTAGGATTGDSPWCCEAVSRVLYSVGVYDLCNNPGAFGGWVNGCAYVPYVTHRFRGGSQWIAKGQQRPGDLVIFVWGGSGSNSDGDHIGMVSGTPGGGINDDTWEGNSSGPDGVGDEVALHSNRNYNEVLGFVRPSYGANQAAPAPARPAPALAHPTVPGEPPFSLTLFLTSPHYIVAPQVRTWQTKMRQRGWNIAIDGVFGPASDSIAKQFQSDCNAHGWNVGAVDGIVGPNTWHATWARPVTH